MNNRARRLLLLVFLSLSFGLVHAQVDEPLPLYELPLGNVPTFTSSSMVLANNGRTLLAANMLNDTVSLVDTLQRIVRVELAVGDDPRSTAFTRDDAVGLVTNRADGTVSVIDIEQGVVTATHPVGLLPYAVITDDDNTAFVSVQGTSEVVQIDIASGNILARIPTPDFPAGLTLWGDFLYVTHFWSGELSLIYLPQQAVVRTVGIGVDTSLSQSMVIDPQRGLGYLPQSRSNAQNTAPTFDTLILPVVNVIDLADLSIQREARIALDITDRPVNMPFAAALDRTRNWIHIVSAGSDSLSIIDLTNDISRGHLEVGANPRGVQLSRDSNIIYVHNMIDGSITFADVRSLDVIDVLPISELVIPIDLFLGAQLFHSAADPRMAQDQWVSCASCHFDGQSDGRVWQGLHGGPRNTPVLYDLLSTEPYLWTGEWPALTDVELKIREWQAGTGLVEGDPIRELGDLDTSASLDLETLMTYLASIDAPPSPPPADPALVAQGAAVFEALECQACHAGEAGTDGEAYDVGTGGTFDTPTINWLWQSAPYFHDGRATTLDEVFILPGTHQLVGNIPIEDIEALITYLNTRP